MYTFWSDCVNSIPRERYRTALLSTGHHERSKVVIAFDYGKGGGEEVETRLGLDGRHGKMKQRMLECMYLADENGNVFEAVRLKVVVAKS